ncbi:T9SS type A sorting domain-containing protein [Bizionia argentinensis JUB59]|uniref:T9SS type A sorting domain-containing protein n=1 Tax=Bizionia argentinensis JUB59 TaxID=1046627 RepID=G2EGJ8_9FLAO|nr:LamG-like jellyroll fold domain-containing protein [Bizionia argentinensis]EGV42451.1 T9SS type A sorting domain-containing protein [Bizionia argentinensis JUB59]
MKLKLYLLLLAFISLNSVNAAYYFQVSNVDPLTGGQTYLLNEASNPLELSLLFCAFGSNQPSISTTYTITWYKNTINSTVGGIMVDQSNQITPNQYNVPDIKTFLPSTTEIGSFYYYAVLSNPQYTSCGFTDTLTSTIQRVDVLSPATNLNFDGVDDRAEVNISSLPLANAPRTVEAWVKTSATNVGTIVNYGNQSTNQRFGILMTNDGRIGVIGENNDYIAPTGSVNDNNWHHVAVTFNGSVLTIFVDGVSVGSTNKSYSTNGNLLSLGSTFRTTFWGEFFNGNMDEVRVWNTARTASQINSSKNCELQGIETGLVAYYNFNQGNDANNNSTITTLTDATANTYNGTLSNFALTGATSNFLAGSPIISGYTIPNTPTATALIMYEVGETANVLTATTSGTGLLWYTTETGGTGSTTAPTPDTSVVGSKSYWVSSTNVNGCESERLEIVVDVEATMGIDSESMLNNIDIYPNPTKGNISITLPNMQDSKITVYDLNGRLLLNQSNSGKTMSVDLSAYEAGIYLFKVEVNGNETMKRIVKQ